MLPFVYKFMVAFYYCLLIPFVCYWNGAFINFLHSLFALPACLSPSRPHVGTASTYDLRLIGEQSLCLLSPLSRDVTLCPHQIFALRCTYSIHTYIDSCFCNSFPISELFSCFHFAFEFCRPRTINLLHEQGISRFVFVLRLGREGT